MFNPSDINLASLYESLNPAINPNLNLFFPQPVLLPPDLPSSEPVLNPPPTDPHAPSGSNDAQPPVSDDPNAGSRSWVMEQADTVTHSNAINSVNEKSMVSRGLYTPVNNVLTNQLLENDVTKTVPQKIKAILPTRCEVCDLDCNSNDVYERHISGKKHKKKSEMHNNPATTVFVNSSAAAGENLETKRQKLVEGGATVVFTRVCDMCNVVCNSQEMFDKHVAGKKHTALACKYPQDGMELSVAANPDYISGFGPTAFPQNQHTGPCERDPNKTSADQIARCEVCNICCTSNNVLLRHTFGRKHLKNLEKVRKIETVTSTPAPTGAPVTTVLVTRPMEEVSQGESDELKNEYAAESQALGEDSETKKRKTMENGEDGAMLSFAANPDSVSGISPTVLPRDNKNGGCESDPNQTSKDIFAWCEVCNIYCTSDDGLVVHKLGKKHLKNLKKPRKTESGTSTRASANVPVMTVPEPEPMKNPEASQGETDELINENAGESQTPSEDSGTKKRKVMEGGADGIEQSVAVNPDSVCGISPTVLPQDNKSGECGSDANKIGADRFPRCQVCNVYCTSNSGLMVHKLGKKHIKNLMELRKTETDATTLASTHAPVMTVLIPGPIKNPEASQGETDELNNENTAESQTPREDLEAQKWKIMEEGADGTVPPVAANSDSVSGISYVVLPLDNKKGGCESDPNKTRKDKFSWCEVCNVYCTSNDVLIVHRLGKKHLKNLRKLRKTETDTSPHSSTEAQVAIVPVPGPMKCSPDKIPEVSQGETEELNYENVAESQMPREESGTKKPRIMECGADAIEQYVAANPDSVGGISPMVLPQDNKNRGCESDASKISRDQFVSCKVYNFYCTGNDVQIVHKSGKKHLTNLELDISSSASTNALVLSIRITGPTQNLEPSQDKIDDLKNKNEVESQALEEDLEMKKRKIMEVGAAGDAVRVCTICNVVCNSQTVLDSHFAGQKHASMLRKQAAARFK